MMKMSKNVEVVYFVGTKEGSKVNQWEMVSACPQEAEAAKAELGEGAIVKEKRL
jgi:hypothetical protein